MPSRDDNITLYDQLLDGAVLKLYFPDAAAISSFRSGLSRYKGKMDEAFESVDLQTASQRKVLSIRSYGSSKHHYEVKLADKPRRSFIILEGDARSPGAELQDPVVIPSLESSE